MDRQPVTSTVWKIEVGKIETSLTFKDDFERLETGTRPLHHQSQIRKHRRSSDANLSLVSVSSDVLRDILALAEMTRSSDCALATEGEWSFCALCGKARPKCEKTCRFTGTRAKNQLHCFRTCLTFCFKNQERMEEREPLVDSHVEGTKERMRELTKKWFVDTQVPLIVQNGLLPTWFLGFITRKDAEKILREKELGCFLVRLSNKSIGYILSYKGRDRCRHFLINQSQSGHFLVYGDNRVHDTVPDLIEYYRTSPIQPFGERLTTSCFEAVSEELYDIIQVGPEEKPVLERPPSPPPRSNRTLMEEEAPPLPRRSRNLDGGLPADQDGLLYARLRKKSPKRMPYNCQKKILEHKQGRSAAQARKAGRTCAPPPAAPQTIYSKLGRLDSRSKSLPLLDGEQTYSLSSSPRTPPRRIPRPVSQTYGCEQQRQPQWLDSCSSSSSSRDRSWGSWENMSDGAVYYLAGRPGSPHVTRASKAQLQQQQQQQQQQHEDSVYADVRDLTREPTRSRAEAAQHEDGSDTYEPVEDVRPKHKHSTWVSKNEKWKWLFPEARRK